MFARSPRNFARKSKSRSPRPAAFPLRIFASGRPILIPLPTLRYFRQWGRLPESYRNLVAAQIVEAVGQAFKDMAPAKLFLGKERVGGARMICAGEAASLILSGSCCIAFAPWREKMVGAVRFELTTFCTPSRRAYQATLRPDLIAQFSAEGIIGRNYSDSTTFLACPKARLSRTTRRPRRTPARECSRCAVCRWRGDGSRA